MATFVVLKHPFTILVTDLTKTDNLKINQLFFVFNTRELSVNTKGLRASTLEGLTQENCALDTLAVHYPKNGL